LIGYCREKMLIALTTQIGPFRVLRGGSGNLKRLDKRKIRSRSAWCH